MKTTIKFLAVCVVLFAAQETTAAPPSFTGLGDLPGGSFGSSATGVSLDGSIIVGQGSSPTGVAFSPSGGEAFRWTAAGGMVGLGAFPGGGFQIHIDGEDFLSSANGISADGSTIVGNSTTATGGDAFRWTASGGMIGGLGNIGARGVSADGSVVVGVGRSALALGPEATRWTSSGGTVGLGTLPGTFPGRYRSSAADVSADGSVVVGESLTGIGNTRAFRWTSGGGMVDLGVLPGGSISTSSRAYAVSADGSVVVGFSNTPLSTSSGAFRWTSGGGMVVLGDIPSGNFGRIANGVSADGSVVVGQGNFTGGSQGAFIWDATNGVRSVQDILANNLGLDLTGWNLYNAIGVSSDGRTIVGNGINPNGDNEAWVAVVPEPSTFTLAGLGLAAMAAFGWLGRVRSND